MHILITYNVLGVVHVVLDFIVCEINMSKTIIFNNKSVTDDKAIKLGAYCFYDSIKICNYFLYTLVPTLILLKLDLFNFFFLIQTNSGRNG